MTLYLVCGLVVVVIGAIITIYFAGRKAGSAATMNAALTKATEVQSAQLKDSTLPRDPASTAGSLRDHSF